MKPAEETIILKRDEAGRVRMPTERPQQLLDEFERSGLSGVKFAALAGIKYQTFATHPKNHGPLLLIVAVASPAMIIAWFKLRKRNLGPFLDANG